jgi:hypothetical protein
MCLSMELERPNDVLASGEHVGLKWLVMHDGDGHRNGYVRLPAGHPWEGKEWHELRGVVRCHGNVTWTEPDTDSAGWWIGFDCGHPSDLRDPELVSRNELSPGLLAYKQLVETIIEPILGVRFDDPPEVRTQEFVEAECRSICEQAKGQMIANFEPT